MTRTSASPPAGRRPAPPPRLRAGGLAPSPRLRAGGLAASLVALVGGLALVLGACEGAGVAPDAPGTATAALSAACVAKAAGTEDTCRSAASWTAYAEAACSAEGAVVGELFVGDTCGDDRYRKVEFSCCDSDAPSFDVAPEGDGCFVDWLGSEDMCASSEVLREAAVSSCAVHGGEIEISSLASPCGDDAFHFVKYRCCAAGQGAEPAATCFAADVGGASCATEATLAAEAAEVCAAQGTLVDGYRLGDACAPGRYDGMRVRCCPSALASTGGNPAPDQPVQACYVSYEGGSGACQDETAWYDVARAACGADDMELTAWKAARSCAPNRYAYVSFECCAALPAAEPAPPQPADACVAASLGNGVLCKGGGAWEEAAAVACGKWGLAVAQSVVVGPCAGGSYTGIDFACCPAADDGP